jgi:hypothetical protein
MTNPVKYDGVSLRLGGRDWIVPPLNLRQLKQLTPALHRLGAAGQSLGEAEIDDIVRIIHAALSRNYPEATEAELAEMLDLGNAATAVRAVAGVSGLVPAGESPAGEAEAGNASTGTI